MYGDQSAPDSFDLAIRDQGGVRISPDEVITVDPILTGRNENKLSDLAERTGVKRTTNLEEALADPRTVFFDASSTLHRARFVEMAAKAGKAVYCEKPTAVTTDEALRLAKLCEDAGVKNGAVQISYGCPASASSRS